MSIYEYNEEEHMRMEREEFFQKGYQKACEDQKAIIEQERKRSEALAQKMIEQKNSANAGIERLKNEIARLKNLS